MATKARYTVKFVAGERRGSLLVMLSPTQPCARLIDAVKKRIPDVNDIDATLHLEEPDGPELYPEDTLSDVLPGAKEIVVVVFQVSSTQPLGIVYAIQHCGEMDVQLHEPSSRPSVGLNCVVELRTD